MLSIFEPTRVEVVGDWRRLHSEELQNLNITKYCYGNHIREDEMGWHVACMRDQKCIQSFCQKT
jgi:hypothetical protein